jgi:hypothetical protein
MLKLLNFNPFIKNNQTPFYYLYNLVILITIIHTRWFAIYFIVASVLLPIVFYYFFVLMDYCEAIEEILEIIHGRKEFDMEEYGKYYY